MATAIADPETVDPTRRTDDRDAAAREMREWAEAGDWPLTPSQMANRGDYSRQHYRNVLELYKPDGESIQAEIRVPSDVDVRSYLRGFADARS